MPIAIHTLSKLSQDDREFLVYVVGVLIPDLIESGSDATAEDFQRLVNMVGQLAK